MKKEKFYLHVGFSSTNDHLSYHFLHNHQVILQASPPPKTQAVSAQTSLELLSSTSPKMSESSRTTEKLSNQPAQDLNRDKPNETEGDGNVSQDPSVQQKAANREKTEDHLEESEDGTIEGMESLMNKAFKGQTHLGDPTKIEKVHPDDEGEGEDDDDNDVETGSSSRSMMMTGLLNMALNSEMLGGLEPVDEVDEEKSESGLTSARDSDKMASSGDDDINSKIPGHGPRDEGLKDDIDDENYLQKMVERAEKEGTTRQEEEKITDHKYDPKDNGRSDTSGEKPNTGLPIDLQYLKEDVHSLKNDFKAMKKDVNEIKIDVGDIKKDVKNMNKNLKTDLRVIKESFGGLRDGTVASSIVETASEIDALIEGRAVGRDITVRESIEQILDEFSPRA